MIAVKLMGGLGNQMFQYATARRLAIKHHTDLFIDITGYQGMAAIDTPRHYALECYNITAQIAEPAILVRMLPQDFQPTLIYKLKRRASLDKRLRPLGEPGEFFYNVVTQGASDNTYLLGWWQNEKYFEDIREVLLGEFTPKKTSDYTKKMEGQIADGSSVSIHVRRGDYVTNKYANKTHGELAATDYYKRAIKLMDEKVGNARYYVFSDDLNWCKRNLPLGKSAVFVAAKDYEEIYLMSHCQHNIIANSSFSWWGAWLNQNSDKTVIAPSEWFLDRQTEIVPESWTKL